ncbi:MAG: nitrogen regulation protein NR(I), partial [Burkholderiales bacterium]|nr:nitrogen regulation protein NR(I) [Burkholderiales bacterium]
LEQRVKLGLFREDLFHRLNVIRLRLPPMRERREDIGLLAKFFLQKSARALGVEAKRFSDAALKFLALHDFPGNVRQIENLCHWLTVMAPGQTIELLDLPAELRAERGGELGPGWQSALGAVVDQALKRGERSLHAELSRQFETVLITTALSHTGGRRVEAAALLGMGRNTLTRKINELGLDPDTSPGALEAPAQPSASFPD